MQMDSWIIADVEKLQKKLSLPNGLVVYAFVHVRRRVIIAIVLIDN